MYCDFYSIADGEDNIPEFVDAVSWEIKNCLTDVSDWEFDTIFIGGGTPSLLKTSHIENILSCLNKKFDLSNVKEFTIEANPGEITKDKLKDFRQMGINRLSIGVQSLEPDLLKFLTRIHSVDQVFETYEFARSAGFNNVNCDLIYSIPGQTWDIWQRDLNQIIELEPNHISAYTLTLEKGTDLFKLVKNKKVTMPKDGQTGDWILQTHDILKNAGYPAYEISNFSKPEFKCIHNLHYWRIQPYLAFGPSAHGFDGQNRWNNSRSLDNYFKQIESEKSPISMTEILSEKDKLNEMIGFGLRLKEGINYSKIPEIYLDAFNQNLEIAQQKWSGCFILKEKSISLTTKGMAYCDGIGVDLMMD